MNRIKIEISQAWVVMCVVIFFTMALNAVDFHNSSIDGAQANRLKASAASGGNVTNVVDAAGSVVVDGNARKIFTSYSSVIPGINITDRQLIQSGGNVVFDWQNQDFPSGATIQTIAIGWQKVEIVTTNYVIVHPSEVTNITQRTDVLLVDATSGPITISLPAPVGGEGIPDPQGKSITVKKIDSTASAVTINVVDAYLIDGALTKSLPVQYNSFTFIASPEKWNIISKVD